MTPWPSSAGAGPALSGPPANAAASFTYSRFWILSLPVVAMTRLVECAGGYPAHLAPYSVSASAFASCRPVAPRPAVLSLPSGGRSKVGRAVGGFSSPPPPPPSVPPLSGLGRCGGSQGFDSLGGPHLSGGQVIP